MKKLLKKSVKYVFSIVPLTAIVIIANFKTFPGDSYLKRSLAPGISKAEAPHQFVNPFGAGLPCGFVPTGPKLQTQRATFTTNNDVPVLLYPAGNYAGINGQISDAVFSEHQNDQLILQGDGNLVIYCTSCSPVKALWSTETRGKGGKALFLQTDGQLVLKNENGKTVWHSTIQSKCAGSELVYFTLQDDGNLVMQYNQAVDNNGVSIAAPPITATAPPVSNNMYAFYLGSTASTNDQVKSPHPGKIQ